MFSGFENPVEIVDRTEERLSAVHLFPRKAKQPNMYANLRRVTAQAKSLSGPSQDDARRTMMDFELLPINILDYP